MKKPVVIILLVVALLFVLAGIGATLFFAFNGRETVFNRLVSASAEESKSLKVDAESPVTLNVVDDAGNVTIVSGDVDSIQVNVLKTAHAPTQARADEELKQIKYAIKQAGNSITIRYTIPNLRSNTSGTVLSSNWETVDFVVTVPQETTVDVDAGIGEVSVSGTRGNMNILSDFGDVTVKNVEGRLAVNTDSGQVDISNIDAGNENIELLSGFGKILLRKATGKDIRLDSRSGALEMSDVRASGDVILSTDFGDIDFSSSSANLLQVETESGKITLNKLNLQDILTANSDFGEVGLVQVKAASYDLQTSSGAITADGVLGKVKAHSGFGSVTVTNATEATLDLHAQSGAVNFEGSLGDGPHTVYSEFGEITITIPADSALNVDLKTDFGSVKSEIPMTVTLSGDLEEGRQTGTMNDGGDQLTVETQSGNISIQASK